MTKKIMIKMLKPVRPDSPTLNLKPQSPNPEPRTLTPNPYNHINRYLRFRIWSPGYCSLKIRDGSRESIFCRKVKPTTVLIGKTKSNLGNADIVKSSGRTLCACVLYSRFQASVSFRPIVLKFRRFFKVEF